MRTNIRASYTKFSESSGPILKVMARIQAEAPAAMRDKDLSKQHHAMQHGSVVLLSGFLESFLRSVCEVFFLELHGRGVGFKELKKYYLDIHLREGAAHLADLVKRESKKKTSALSDSSAFARRLGAPFSDESKAPVWEAFARTKGNPSSSVVKSVLSTLGVNGGFDSLSEAIGKKYSPTVMIQFLDTLIELRNESAHTGSTSSVPPPSYVIDTVQYCRYLTLAICRLVDRRLTELLHEFNK